MANEGLRTTTAQQAMAVTEIVNRTLADKVVGFEPKKRLQIRDVDGPSTDGGKRARQSIVLLPIDGSVDGGAMCGWVDTARGEAELRTHQLVAGQHLERYRRPFDVGRMEYDAVMAELKELLALGAVEVRTVDHIDAPIVPRARRSRAGALLLVVFAVAALSMVAFVSLR